MVSLRRRAARLAMVGGLVAVVAALASCGLAFEDFTFVAGTQLDGSAADAPGGRLVDARTDAQPASDAESSPPGPRSLHERCTRGPDPSTTCRAGHVCLVQPGYDEGICVRSCNDVSDCPSPASSWRCVSLATSIPGKQCAAVCDPLTVGICGPDGMCKFEPRHPQENPTLCEVAGTGLAGDYCYGWYLSNECAPGFACSRAWNPCEGLGRCERLCRVGMNDCPDGGSCGGATSTVGGVSYGSCR